MVLLEQLVQIVILPVALSKDVGCFRKHCNTLNIRQISNIHPKTFKISNLYPLKSEAIPSLFSLLSKDPTISGGLYLTVADKCGAITAYIALNLATAAAAYFNTFHAIE
jgi:hypothetical protein